MKKQTRKKEFSPKARKEIRERDKGMCIFCAMGYCPAPAGEYGAVCTNMMHYIPRSKGGLGIPENGAVGCIYHHEMFDNGNRGRREEMKSLFREYLKSKYPDWEESRLTYKKWADM